MKSTVSVVIPVFNEVDNIDELVDRCVATCEGLQRPYEILLVDDGSRDGSREKIEAKAMEFSGRVEGLFLNRNYGQHSAVRCGLAHARGDLVVTLDADLQNPPEEIARLVAKADEGYDVVGSVRINRQDSLFRRFASHLINACVKKTTGVSMHDYGCMLRAYRRSIVRVILDCGEHSTFLPVLANSFARHTTEIDVEHCERRAGESKYGFMKLTHLMFDLVTSMTTVPLRLLTLFGAGMCVLSVGLGSLILVLRFTQGAEWAANGVFTLFALAFFFLGALFVAVGLLGEYVGRIHIDVQARPRYLVDRKVGTTELVRPAAATRPEQPTLDRQVS